MKIAETPQNLTVGELEQYWLASKAQENEARKDRLTIETMILEHPDANLKEQGATKLSALRITTGVARSFDQSKLSEIIEAFPSELWPFKTEFKEIKAGSDYIEKNEPELWEQIRPALTIKPKKAAFAVIPEKKEVA